jgi:hypothetical protein
LFYKIFCKTKIRWTLKEPCKKYTALTAERLPRVDPIPKI